MGALFNACREKEVVPITSIEGTWSVSSYISKTDNEAAVDIFAFFADLKPCIKEGKITFMDGKYTTTLPANCVDEDGAPLQLFPENPTGTYNISENGKMTIMDGSFVYAGEYKFKSASELEFVIQEGNETVTVVFTKR